MTEADAREYLEQLGLTIPDVMLTALIARIGTISDCISQYPADVQTLIEFYLVGLLAITSGGRRIRSQAAPSGASQSYSYGTLIEQQRQLVNALRLIDTEGCTTDLIPAEPGARAFLFVAKGDCY